MRIELTTSFLPRMRSTTELQGRGIGRDLNPHKPDSQSGALTNYATYTVAVGGIEPPTTSL